MKKIVGRVLIVLALLISVLMLPSEETITTTAKTYMEGNKSSPVCFVTVSSSIKYKSQNIGSIVCNSENELKDTDISTSDIAVSSFLFDRVKINNIFNFYSIGNKYSWNFTYTGVFFGRSTIYLRSGSVVDIYGNTNSSSASKR